MPALATYGMPGDASALRRRRRRRRTDGESGHAHVHARGVRAHVRVKLLRAVIHGKRDGHGVVTDTEVVVETEGHVGDFNVAHDVETNVVFDGAERGYVPGIDRCNILIASCVKAVVLVVAGGGCTLSTGRTKGICLCRLGRS